MNAPTLLFVYGTLRPAAGHAMGAWLRRHADWQGPAVLPRARLYRVDWYPAVVPGLAQDAVHGDLFALHDAATLWPRLDDFEAVRGAPDDEYARGLSRVRQSEGREVVAWVYWYRRPVHGLAWLPGGDWLSGAGESAVGREPAGRQGKGDGEG